MREALLRYRTEGRAWLNQRSARERLLLYVLAILGVIYLVYSLVLTPVAAARQSALADIESYEIIMARLDAAGPVAESRGPVSTLPPSQAIAASAAEAGLDIRRLEPQGAETSVMLDQVSFDRMVVWINMLEQQHGLVLVGADITRRPEPGTVNASLSLERRGV